MTSLHGKALVMAMCNRRDAFWIVVLSVIIASAASITSARAPVEDSVLNLKPIEMKPEPVGQLHPKWQWLKEKKIRMLWQPDGVARTFPGTDKSVAQVLADAGFNPVYSMYGIDRQNRSTSPRLEELLPVDQPALRRGALQPPPDEAA